MSDSIKTKVDFNPQKLRFNVFTTVDEMDVMLHRNKEFIIENVILSIGREIAKKVVEKLEPHIDKSIQEAFKEHEKAG